MGYGLITNTTLENIANAIRYKTGGSATYTPANMASAINSIPTGGANLGPKTITSNGIYNASDDNLDGYNSVTIQVPSGGGDIVITTNGLPLQNVFNAPVTIQQGVTNCANLFANLYNYNSAVDIPSSVSQCYQMFYNCQNLNQQVNIGENVVNCSMMFYNCVKLNRAIEIPNKVSNADSMFASCGNFNQPITIPSSVSSCKYMFSSCYNFNQPVTIPATVVNADYMFQGSSNFNSLVTIENGVKSCSYLFAQLGNYNQPVTIPNSVNNCRSMIEMSAKFNQPVIIGENVTNCNSMFYSSNSFNQPIRIPDNVTDCNYIFSAATKMNSDVIFGNKANLLYSSFSGCNDFAGNIFINNTVADVRRMFQYVSNSFKKTVYCNDLTNLLGTTYSNSITGSAITWTATDNGYYNATNNIYLYNNYDPSAGFIYLNYFSSSGSKMLHRDWGQIEFDGTWNYGTDEWSDTPNGSPVSGILNNISANMNVYYAGTVILNSAHIYTYSTSGSDASINIEHDGVTETLNYRTARYNNTDFANVARVNFNGSYWFVNSLGDTTDGTNNYSDGDTIRSWLWSATIDFNVRERAEEPTPPTPPTPVTGANAIYLSLERNSSSGRAEHLYETTGTWDGTAFTPNAEPVEILNTQSSIPGPYSDSFINASVVSSGGLAYVGVAVTNLTDGTNVYAPNDEIFRWLYRPTSSYSLTLWEQG